MRLQPCFLASVLLASSASSVLSAAQPLERAQALPRAKVLDVSFTLTNNTGTFYPSIKSCEGASLLKNQHETLAALVLDQVGADILSDALQGLEPMMRNTLREVYAGSPLTKPALLAILYNESTGRYRVTGCYAAKERLNAERMVYKMRLPNGQTMYPSLGFCASHSKSHSESDAELDPVRAVALSDAGMTLFAAAARDRINTEKSETVQNLWLTKQHKSHTRLSTLLMLTAPETEMVTQFDFEAGCGGNTGNGHQPPFREYVKNIQHFDFEAICSGNGQNGHDKEERRR